MLRWINARLVGHPGVLAGVAAAFLGVWALGRIAGAATRPSVLLWLAVGWAAWAAWELLLRRLSPDANIRADLLLVLPVVLIGTVLGLVMAFWPAAGA